MVKVYRIPGTDVKIRISQDVDGWLRIGFNSTKDYLLNPITRAEEILALGFEIEKPKPEPIDGGDLEEVTE